MNFRFCCNVSDVSPPSASITNTTPLDKGIKLLELENQIWNLASPRLLKACQEGEPVLRKDRKTFFGRIADYMTTNDVDISRTTCAMVAEKIYQKYPLSFGDNINGRIYGKGYESLLVQLYNGVNYRKHETSKRKKQKDNDSDEAEESLRIEKQKYLQRMEDYGCAEYQPRLPDYESTKSQEDKRLELIQLFSISGRDENQVRRLMEETYCTQRALINAKLRNLPLIFREWPFLKETEYFILHANRLLGKDVFDTWVSSLHEKAKYLRQYLETFQYKDDKKREFLKIVNDCKSACKFKGTKTAKALATFPLLVFHFLDNEDLFFKIVDVRR